MFVQCSVSSDEVHEANGVMWMSGLRNIKVVELNVANFIVACRLKLA